MTGGLSSLFTLAASALIGETRLICDIRSLHKKAERHRLIF
jgi:hypothetical protein